ncbi:MAG TPA: hypothetical protein VHB48_00205, partial [Chitinophagaceae bacterium]|nr:hypothetical protein [Chitinophagaceae bacterium]
GNDRMRVLNVLIPPGDTSLYHLHSTPSVFITFTATKTGSQLWGAGPQHSVTAPGVIYFENLAAPHTRIHRVWNEDKDTFHVMDIELLGNHTGFTQPPLQHQYLHKVVDTPWARAYKITLPPGTYIKLADRKASLVLIAVKSALAHIIENGAERQSALQPGQVVGINDSEHFTLLNAGTAESVFALVELAGD